MNSHYTFHSQMESQAHHPAWTNSRDSVNRTKNRGGKIPHE